MTICIYLHFGKPIFQSYHFGMVHTTHLRWFWGEFIGVPMQWRCRQRSPVRKHSWTLPIFFGTGHLFGMEWDSLTVGDFTTTRATILPSGKHTKSYWKWPSRNRWFTHFKWWFSIVMLVYQRALGKLCIATSLFSLTGIVVNKGYHPNIAKLFRFVKYYNLPRYYILGYSWTSYD